MKRFLLLAAITLRMMSAEAQQVEVTLRGNIQENGYTFTTNSVAVPSATITPNKLRFSVTNISQEAMYVGAKLISMSSNVDGENLQYCFGSYCLPSVTPGLIIPYEEELAAGATTPSEDDHFINSNPGNDGNPVTYNLAIVKLIPNGEDGFTEGETLFTFNYVYSATAGVQNNLMQLGLSLENTVVKNTLAINSNDAGSMQLVAVTGAAVYNTNLVNGNNSVDLSSVASGVYFAKFTVGSKVATVKIIKN